MLVSVAIEELRSGKHSSRLEEIYGESEKAIERYVSALEGFKKTHGDLDVHVYSAPGRSEIGGNHTDHQHGKVLAAAINLDMICVVSLTDDNVVELVSEGFEIKPVDLKDLAVNPAEAGTSEAIIRGIANKFVELGKTISGFKGYMISSVLGGSGLSSSAAFESLIGSIFSYGLNDGSVDAVEIAKIGQYAENVYFGKPCGLMDQTACSVGGFVHIDFAAEPVVVSVDFDMNKTGYSLCIVDTKGSHADLTDEYAAVPREMKDIAHFFKEEYLNDVDPEKFYESISELRKLGNDRSVLRALHFFEENKRVVEQVEALRNDDFNGFLQLVKASGNSSYRFLQNVYANSDYTNQEIGIALALSERLLKDRGVARVHGGGFAGTIQVYVPNDLVDEFTAMMNGLFGEGSVYILQVRKHGGVKVF